MRCEIFRDALKSLFKMSFFSFSASALFHNKNIRTLVIERTLLNRSVHARNSYSGRSSSSLGCGARICIVCMV